MNACSPSSNMTCLTAYFDIIILYWLSSVSVCVIITDYGKSYEGNKYHLMRWRAIRG